MAKAKALSRQNKLRYATVKALRALKWLVASGVVTYFLVEVAKIIPESNMYALIVVNTLLYGVAKYREGEDK